MDYIIIILLITILIVCVISLSKNINESNITERLGKVETNITKEVGDFKIDFSRVLTEDFNHLNERIESRLNSINEKVNMRLDENFEKTNKTFTSVLERLSKIDEAQKKIESLSSDIVSLQSVLTDKKSRGIFGEVNLKHILSNVFGEKNDAIYEMQHSFANGFVADAVLYAPLPLGTIAIDSKFPLENYQLMVDKKISSIEREKHEKDFKNDVKKHIDAIASKYIIPTVTSDQAIMFLPAEAIFAEINAYHQDIIDYANKKRVWITSPTTLMSTLTVVQMVVKNMERDKYASIIQEELTKLGVQFNHYRDRWDKLSRSIETVSKDVASVHITTEKISKRFDSINKVDVDKIILLNSMESEVEEDESELQQVS
ncbi:MAG: DNA recombination protein RmuC [Bacilli bacterium]|nr:DNA recombination protein RmuC [Bacilli bacterium]MDD4298160.1 DNA recombination protein RmuC [Bacilli bacterium]MDD4643807.1 DNA recombination protein RmuC [Bacilli bacterium]